MGSQRLSPLSSPSSPLSPLWPVKEQGRSSSRKARGQGLQHQGPQGSVQQSLHRPWSQRQWAAETTARRSTKELNMTKGGFASSTLRRLPSLRLRAGLACLTQCLIHAPSKWSWRWRCLERKKTAMISALCRPVSGVGNSDNRLKCQR